LQGLSTTIVGSPVVDGDTLYGFGYGSDEPPLFAPRLQQFDKNKDGRISPDEYGNDPIMNGIGKMFGNRDGIVTEDEWQTWQKKVLGPNCLFAVKIEDGRPHELWRYEKSFTGVIPSVLAYQGVLYVARNGGILTTHDAATGNVIKAARVEGALGGYSSSPVAADGKVWLGSEEGKMAVLKAAGDWQLLQVNDLGEGIYATPALSKGVIYLRTEEALYAFSQQSGR
jgi:outer membrane protein assembly factor BamB